MNNTSASYNVPVPEPFIPHPHLLDLAANRIIVAHHLRIRFLNLMRNIMYPRLIETLLGKGYRSERLHAVKKQAFAMYSSFKSTGKGFRDLDGLNCQSRWIECHAEAMSEFDNGVELLEAFEAEADNLAVEWECAMMFPLPKVEIGDLFPGIEDRKDHEHSNEGQRDRKQP
jgi:hypothetical protein